MIAPSFKTSWYQQKKKITKSFKPKVTSPPDVKSIAISLNTVFLKLLLKGSGCIFLPFLR